MKKILLILSLIVSLQSSEVLRQEALKYGLKSVPKDYNSLVKLLEVKEKKLFNKRVILGKKLFFEKALSLNNDISCASCHSFKKGGVDGLSTAVGHKNQKNPYHLNTPTVLNTAFSKQFFWDGRSKSLENQATGPLQANFEMAITPELAEERIRDKKEYQKFFLEAFEDEEISFEKIVKAISIYERTLLTRGVFDDFLDGDLEALNSLEKEGLELFITKSCVGCHTGIGLGGQELRRFPLVHHTIWSMKDIKFVKSLLDRFDEFLEKQKENRKYFSMQFNSNDSRYEYLLKDLGKEDLELLTNGFFHNLKEEKAYEVISQNACTICHDKKNNKVNKELLSKQVFPFENRGGFVGTKDLNRFFRVPLLRNVAKTYPYFHNGEVTKLEDAIKIMVKHQHRTKISDDEVKKIVAFLKSVDGDLVSYSF